MTAQLPPDCGPRLRAAIAKQLLEVFENGMIVTDQNDKPVLDADGKEIRIPPPAAMFTAAVNFLKQFGGRFEQGREGGTGVGTELAAIAARANKP